MPPPGFRDRRVKPNSGYGDGELADRDPTPDNSLSAALGDAGVKASEDRGSTPRTSTCETAPSGAVSSVGGLRGSWASRFRGLAVRDGGLSCRGSAGLVGLAIPGVGRPRWGLAVRLVTPLVLASASTLHRKRPAWAASSRGPCRGSPLLAGLTVSKAQRSRWVVAVCCLIALIGPKPWMCPGVCRSPRRPVGSRSPGSTTRRCRRGFGCRASQRASVAKTWRIDSTASVGRESVGDSA